MNFFVANLARRDRKIFRPANLTRTLAAWPLRSHTALKSILWETLFLDQLHDFSLVSLNYFILSFGIKIHKKSSVKPKQKSFSKLHFPKHIIATAWTISDSASVGVKKISRRLLAINCGSKSKKSSIPRIQNRDWKPFLAQKSDRVKKF